MDVELQQCGSNAIARIGCLLDRNWDVRHADVQAAVNAVVAFRDRAIKMQCNGAETAEHLNRANAFVSLAYGAEFPLSGLHRHRLEQVRQGMVKLLQGET